MIEVNMITLEYGRPPTSDYERRRINFITLLILNIVKFNNISKTLLHCGHIRRGR